MAVRAPVSADVAGQERGGMLAGVGQCVDMAPPAIVTFPSGNRAFSRSCRSSMIAAPLARNYWSVQAGQSGAASSAPAKGSATANSSSPPQAVHLPFIVDIVVFLETSTAMNLSWLVDWTSLRSS